MKVSFYLTSFSNYKVQLFQSLTAGNIKSKCECSLSWISFLYLIVKYDDQLSHKEDQIMSDNIYEIVNNFGG